MDSEKNKYSLGNTGGRPPTFENPEELEGKCIEYLKHCIKNKEKPTITGLTLFVGFCSRSSWDDYLKRDGFSYIVKRAKLTIQNSYEQSGGVFDIFALKNMGWKDKSEVVNTNLNYDSKELSIKDMKEYTKSLEDEF